MLKMSYEDDKGGGFRHRQSSRFRLMVTDTHNHSLLAQWIRDFETNSLQITQCCLKDYTGHARATVVVVVEVEIDICRGMDLKAGIVDWVGGGKKRQDCPG